MRTTFIGEFDGSEVVCTEFAQRKARSPDRRVKFPVTVEYYDQRAKIYTPAKGFPFYRIAFKVAGKRRMLTFGTYSEAKKAAEDKVKELHKGQQSSALTATQTRDALAAFERLQEFFQATGRRVSLLSGISEYCEAATKLQNRTFSECVDGYMRNVASVKRKEIKEAAAEFLLADAPRAKTTDGKRAQLSAKYVYNRKLQLDRFSDTFQNTAVSDLTKEHLDTFISSLGEFSAKSRNHYRAVIRQFLQWAVRKDYLTPTHRLLEADAMRPELANNAAVELYTPQEFAALLAAAKSDLRPLLPIVAIGGLAGLRTAELLLLDWADVWRRPGQIDITADKAKTRQRRTVKICPALAAWLKPFRSLTTGKLWTGHEVTYQQHFVELCRKATLVNKGKKTSVTRKTNGLRHSFCTFHLAAYENEDSTALQAGNSPAMIHAHYKELTTKSEAKKWFAVFPPKAAKNVSPPKAATKV